MAWCKNYKHKHRLQVSDTTYDKGNHTFEPWVIWWECKWHYKNVCSWHEHELNLDSDTVDHSILLSCLKHCVGIKGFALEWFKSYLADRSFCVQLGQFSSSVASLTCGTPQGSVLGPQLEAWYLFPLFCRWCAGVLAIKGPLQGITSCCV